MLLCNIKNRILFYMQVRVESSHTVSTFSVAMDLGGRSSSEVMITLSRPSFQEVMESLIRRTDPRRGIPYPRNLWEQSYLSPSINQLGIIESVRYKCVSFQLERND